MQFDNSIKRAYGTVLDNLYFTCLHPIYELSPDDENWPEDDIQNSLGRLSKRASTKGINVDYDSYLTYVCIWKFVSNKMNLPIPLLERIIPMVMSHWNNTKGGSDTYSKVLAQEDCRLPTKDPQAFSVARMFKIIARDCHRKFQILGAKKDVTWYNDISHFRNANNRRQSFHGFLVKASHELVQAGGRFMKEPPGHGVLTQVQEPNFPVPEGVMRATYISAKTGKTPTRRKLSNNLNHANSANLDLMSRMVQIRQRYCIGVPVRRLSPGNLHDKKKSTKGRNARGNCTLCGAETRSFCVGCKRFLCDEVRETWINENIIDKKRFMAFTEDIYSGRTCFNIEHHHARNLFFAGLNPWKPFVGNINSVEEVCKYCNQFPDVTIDQEE